MAAPLTYPVRLDFDADRHITRWHPLVQWLLAIPHYLVVGILLGGTRTAWSSAGEPVSISVTGLLPLLVFVAVVVLLVSGRYPRPLYDLIVGLDRWIVRVIAYAALMTDRYPPFRLDQGPVEATAERVPEPAAEPPG